MGIQRTPQGDTTMTQEVGGYTNQPRNPLDIKTLETKEISGDKYIQKAFNQETQEYSLLYREHGRYSKPITLSHGITQEKDIDQLMLEAETRGINQLLKPQTGEPE